MANHEDIVTTKEITLSMGPQHPSAHGVLHLVLDMQGERILKASPDIGYLHRGTEKIVENLLEIEMPERAKYIRVVAAEMSRIAGHLLSIGAWALDLGAMTVLLYA